MLAKPNLRAIVPFLGTIDDKPAKDFLIEIKITSPQFETLMNVGQHKLLGVEIGVDHQCLFVKYL